MMSRIFPKSNAKKESDSDREDSLDNTDQNIMKEERKRGFLPPMESRKFDFNIDSIKIQNDLSDNDMSINSDNPKKIDGFEGKTRNCRDLGEDSERKTPISNKEENKTLRTTIKTIQKNTNIKATKEEYKSTIFRSKTKKNENEMLAQIEIERNRKADAKSLRQAKQYKYFIILPDDKIKDWWDMFINLVLLFVFFVTPYRIAFIDTSDYTWKIIDYLIDLSFVIDMALTFFMAYYNFEPINLYCIKCKHNKI